MSRRSTGVAFCAIAATLYISRYITAAIFGAGVSSWNAPLFRGMLSYVGSSLLILSFLSFAIGIVYLVWAEKSKEK